MIQKVNHVSITVKDLDQVVAWFRDVFGLTKVLPTYEHKSQYIESVTGLPGAHLRVGKVQVGDFVLEFIQYLSPPGRELKGNTNDVGYPHIGFEVDDIEEMYKTLTQRGVEFKSPPVSINVEGNPMGGWRVAYFWGPEGMTLELMQRPK